ncbi:unnamed protein product [Discula destructiva]
MEFPEYALARLAGWNRSNAGRASVGEQRKLDSSPKAHTTEHTTLPLPVELRRIIWELCFFTDEPAMLYHDSRAYTHTMPQGMVAQRSYPITMQINHESRHWTITLVRESEEYTLGERRRQFNPAIDTLFLPRLQDLVTQNRPLSTLQRRSVRTSGASASCYVDCSHVQHIALPREWVTGRKNGRRSGRRWLLDDLLRTAAPALRSISVAVNYTADLDITLSAQRMPDVPHRWLPGSTTHDPAHVESLLGRLRGDVDATHKRLLRTWNMRHVECAGKSQDWEMQAVDRKLSTYVDGCWSTLDSANPRPEIHHIDVHALRVSRRELYTRGTDEVGFDPQEILDPEYYHDYLGDYLPDFETECVERHLEESVGIRP